MIFNEVPGRFIKDTQGVWTWRPDEAFQSSGSECWVTGARVTKNMRGVLEGLNREPPIEATATIDVPDDMGTPTVLACVFPDLMEAVRRQAMKAAR